MKNLDPNNTQNTENQTVIYLNEFRTPFTLYCSHIGYIKGFQRVSDAFDFISSWKSHFQAMMIDGCFASPKSVEVQIIEHLEEHGKKDKIICKFKAMDLLKKRFDNL